MEDERIIELFNTRSEDAILAIKEKYGGRATAVAVNIIGSAQDAEEAVNDALHTLWQRIPPEKPRYLWAYFSKVVRNISCDRVDYRQAARRTQSCEVCFSELEGCLTTGEDPQGLLESQDISDAINRFLKSQDRENRIIFVRRYYYFDSCAQIAKHLGITRGAVNTRLTRMRGQLRKALEKEEIFV
jgi:RNA polymerase sigma-70 factor (ECF subfamily)